MSQDFVRRMPSAGFGQTRTVGLGEKFHLDIPIILLLVMICTYGLLILYSAVGQQTAPVVNQLIKIGVAFGLMIVMAQISPIFYLRIAPWLFVMGIVLLIAVLFVGTTVNGSQRWLRIPGVLNFQPSELMKLVIPM
ncbi:MAG: FtsW/RodA/SpoVE family cell cycle protein, partial [Gammaproteobacteria bacterium]|nr:FtsW/RodA/SpoVE family cell cycle protein [Gammaproteobacteria bacterium]